jgi:CRP-like cAMP-binding protein
MIDLSTILNSPILNGLTPSDLEALGAIAREEKTVKGERLLNQGTDAKTLYVIQAGRFALTLAISAYGAEEEMVVEEKMAGDALGWSALVEPCVSVYSAYCTSDGSVAAFSVEELDQLMSSHPSFGHRFTANLAQLAGERVRVLQDLWVSEIEQTRERVNFWTGTEMSSRLVHAVDPGHERRSWWHMLFRRNGGLPRA